MALSRKQPLNPATKKKPASPKASALPASPITNKAPASSFVPAPRAAAYSAPTKASVMKKPSTYIFKPTIALSSAPCPAADTTRSTTRSPVVRAPKDGCMLCGKCCADVEYKTVPLPFKNRLGGESRAKYSAFGSNSNNIESSEGANKKVVTPFRKTASGADPKWLSNLSTIPTLNSASTTTSTSGSIGSRPAVTRSTDNPLINTNNILSSRGVSADAVKDIQTGPSSPSSCCQGRFVRLGPEDPEITDLFAFEDSATSRLHRGRDIYGAKQGPSGKPFSVKTARKGVVFGYRECDGLPVVIKWRRHGGSITVRNPTSEASLAEREWCQSQQVLMCLTHQPKSEGLSQVVGLYMDERNHYVVAEMVMGPNLFFVMKRLWAMRPDPRQVEDFVTQVAYKLLLGINELTSAHLVHRDLKLENACLEIKDPNMDLDHVFGAGLLDLISGPSSAWGVKLIDFDTVVPVVSQSNGRAGIHHADIVCGTDQYLAPEAYASGTYSHAADMFSIGVMMHAFSTCRYLFPEDIFDPANVRSSVTGRMPRAGESCMVGLAQEMIDKLAHPEACHMWSRSLWRKSDTWRNILDFIQRCDRIDPKERLTVSAALEHPLFAKIQQERARAQASWYYSI